MGFIYYIYNIKNSAALYIGQDNIALNPYDLNGRIFEHAEIAYGLKTGPFYGAEQLMLENSLSNIGVTIANLSDPCWQAAFQQFSRYWDFLPAGASTDPMINFAEMASIVVYKNRDNLKVVNIQEGGYQSKWICKKEKLLSYSKLAAQYQAFISQDKFEDVIIDPFRGTGAGLKLFAPQIYQLYRLFTIILQKGLFFDSNKHLHPEFIQVIVDSLTQWTAHGSRVEVSTKAFHKNLVKYVSDQWKKMCATLAQDYNNQELLNIPEPKWNFNAFISRFTTWFNKRINTSIGSAQSIVLNALQNKKNSKEQVFGGKQLYSIPAASFANEETMQLIANSVSSITSKTYLQSPFGAWLRTLYNSLPLKLHHNENISLRLRTVSYKYFQKLYNKTIETTQYPTSPWPYLGLMMKQINNGTLIDRLTTRLDINGLWQYSNVYLRQMLTYHLKKLGQSVQDTETFAGDIEYWSSYETAPGSPEPEREYCYISYRGVMYAFKPSTWQRILNYQNLDLKDIVFY